MHTFILPTFSNFLKQKFWQFYQIQVAVSAQNSIAQTRKVHHFHHFHVGQQCFLWAIFMWDTSVQHDMKMSCVSRTVCLMSTKSFGERCTDTQCVDCNSFVDCNSTTSLHDWLIHTWMPHHGELDLLCAPALSMLDEGTHSSSGSGIFIQTQVQTYINRKTMLSGMLQIAKCSRSVTSLISMASRVKQVKIIQHQ